ncbi:MAG TPA: two-component regulator propeller domain-containing protein [Gemmatimonadaceae bacterium]|nr:two-component regulator propeller domain-containing protein [Gemmatimonadaceae bacterium]
MARSSNQEPTIDRQQVRSLGRIALVILALWSAGIAVPARAQTLNFRQYTGAEGLPQAQVMGMYQDRLGYMWFATYGGLSRFDGDRFVTYTKDDGLSSNSVFDVVEDDKDRLVIATSGGICIRDRGAFRCIRQTDGLVSDNARSVTLDADGGIWVGTLAGLSHVAGATIRNFTTANGLPAERVIQVVIDAAKRVWVATPNGIVRVERDRIVHDAPRFPGDTAVEFMTAARGGMLIGAGGHLYLQHGNVVTPVAEGSIPQGTAFADGAVDRNGTIWLATQTGVLRIKAGHVERIGRANGLVSDMVIRVMIDREGDVWFGTESGASKHAPGPFRTYTAAEGLPSPFVRDMVVDQAGSMWVGTRNGVAIRDGEQFHAVTLPNVPDARVYALAREPTGGMLIGTRRGLVWYRNGRTQLYGEKEGLPGEAVYCLLTDGGKGMWVGTERGLAHWENGRLTLAGPPELTKPGIISMARDARGRLWLGRVAGGLAMLAGDSTRIIGGDSGGTDQTIWDVQLDSQGRVWAGTNGDGVLRVDDTGVRRYTTADGLASNFIWQILGDSRGRVWLFGNDGIDRFTGEQLTHFGRGDGLVDLEGTASASFEDAEGDLWFGTGGGLLRYTEGTGQVKRIEPPIFIEETMLDGKPIVADAAKGYARMKRGVVRISFSSPTFRDESAVRFRYRLIGVTDEWSAITSDRSITYAGLAPGRYRFEVIALNGPVRSTVAAATEFQVTPAYWQSWWFRGLGVLLLLGTAAAVPLWRAHSLERERRRLQAIVARHTHELAEKNVRLESSNRDLEHFAYVASHDLQEPLRKIQAFSDRLAKQYASQLDDQGRDYLSRMNGAAARMQRLIEALLSLSRVTTKRKETELIDLAPLVTEVLGDLEVRIQSTGGRVTVGELPRIEGDAVQMRQVFQNLIGNALKFHKPGEPPVVQVYALRRSPGQAEIYVEDSGIGFDRKDAERVFLPFHRLHGRSEYEGTGIGLTICQKIVERHGGTIHAESTPGKGSRFVVSLPTQERIGERHAA